MSTSAPRPASADTECEPAHSVWQGTLIRLRGFTEADWPYFRAFEQDSTDARSVFRIIPPRSAEAHRRETGELASRVLDEEEFALAVESVADGALVGAISTFGVNRRAGRFGYGLAVDRRHRRKGYGTDAVGVLLRYMFGERRMHKCEAEVYAFNEASLAFHEHLGFQREGLLREREFFEGTYHDVVLMGITAPEHRARARDRADALRDGGLEGGGR